MHSRTIATLDKLRHAEWFRCVGVQDTDAAEVLSSWSEAISSSSSIEWENLCLEAANQFCERLLERAPQRFEKWNEIANEIKPVSHMLVLEKTKQVIEENNLPKSFLDTVNWDIAHLCMEAEYADVFPPAYYASQAYWYMQGHFPCGWRGKFPLGKLVIF
jgi:hypothetical protein